MLLAVVFAGLPLTGVGPGKVQAAGGYVFSAGGDGTPGNPFKIESAADLNGVREDLSASYQLAGDIDLSDDFDNWEPIGTYGSPFEGTFDGANHTISGLKIHSDAGYVGLFGQAVGDDMTIQNVRLEEVDITATDIHAQVGALVGSVSRGRLTHISVSGELKGGKVASAGGLTGQISTSATLEHSRSSVNLTFQNGLVGGLAGGLSSHGKIKLSYATGRVSIGGNGAGGGLVGESRPGEILESYATGDVTATDNALSGGLVGNADGGKITNSYAAGRASSASGSSGGLVGGYLYGLALPVVIDNSYWNSDHSPGLTTIGGKPGDIEAISDDQLKDLVAYAGWETAYWGIQQGESYPYLKAFFPVLRVKPLSPVYSAKTANPELKVDGSIWDGSIGEPVQAGYVITNQATGTVVQAVYDAYETYATGEDQQFQFSIILSEADYPDGNYTLTVISADTVEMNEQARQFTFEVDSTPPEIVLTGAGLIALEVGDIFVDPGATATDNRDNVVGIVTSGTVDTSQTGTYTLTYEVTDAAGNTATKTRTVKVYNSLYPEVQLNGPSTVEVEAGGEFNDPGADANDERDGNVTDNIVITGSVDIGRVGTYVIQYRITNSLGNQSFVSRTVKVVDRTPPVLTLLGANPMRIEAGRGFVDPGATAVDIVDGDLKDEITVTGTVYTNRIGTYTLTYRVQDHSGNAAVDAVRTVNVVQSSSSSGGGPIGGGQTGGDSSAGQPGGNSTEGGQPDDDSTGSTTPPVAGCSFTDLEKHWGKPGVCEAAKLGIVEGVSPRIFMPNAAVTRTEFAVMLLRVLRIEIDNEAAALTFGDSDNTPKWAVQAIRTAVARGILTGYPDGTLKPVQTVSRSEMAVMVSRAMKWQVKSERNAHFSDVASIPTWARGYVEAAREHGVLSGRAGNRFAPAEVATRAEAAVVLLRLWKVLY